MYETNAELSIDFDQLATCEELVVDDQIDWVVRVARESQDLTRTETYDLGGVEL